MTTDPVEKALGSADPRTRFEAVRECLALERAASVPALLRVVTDDSVVELRELAARAVGVCGGEDAREPMLAAARGDQALEVRLRCIEAIGWTGDRAAVGGLCALLEDAAAEVRLAALDALREIASGSEEAAAAVERRLADAEADVRALAALALSVLGNAEQRKAALDYALGDPEPAVRLRAAQARVQTGAADAHESYMQAYRACPVTMRAHAARLLVELDRDDAIALLVRIRETDPEPQIVQEANVKLAHRGEPSGVASLARAFYEDGGGFALACALAEVGNAIGERDLRHELIHGHGARRLQAARALYLLGDAEAATLMERLLASRVGADRRYAAFAMATAGDRRALEPLLQTLDFAFLRERREAAGLVERLQRLHGRPLRAPFDARAARLERRRRIEQLRAEIETELASPEGSERQ